MGANGSRCDHYAVDHFHRRRLQKTRSMSTAEYHSTNIGFFPPPILHNLYPELDNNPMIAKEFGGSVTNVVGEHRAEMLLVDMVLTKAANRSSHENIVAKTSSASVVSNNTNGSCSSSSGCESSVSDDNLENYFDQQQQLSSSSSLLAAKPVKCPGKQRLRLYTPRSRGHYGRSKRASIDSGTGCDDDDNNLNSGGAVGASGSSRTIITKRRSVSLCIPHSGSLSLEKNSDEADDTSFGDAVSSAVSAKHESKNSISSNDGSNPNHSYDCDDLNDGDDDDCVNARAVDARLSRRSISMSSCYPQNNSGSATDVANASKLSANSKMRSCGQLPLATAATAAAAADDGLVGDKKKRKKRSKSISKSLKNLRMRAFSLGAISSDEFKRKREKPANELFGSSYLNREWEIVTFEEVRRRLSLDKLEKLALPIPDGATSSQILDESMIRQMLNILPPRAEGYPWVNIYSSEKHGFSLSTLYRKMQEWDEELSPILLVIRDCNDGVFGFIASTAIRPSDHYVGTGDSCLLFKFTVDPETKEKEVQKYSWTGENQFFVKASKDSLSMGAGGGHYGLWLDADLNKGTSLHCETFNNEPLSDGEDFRVQFLECYGFRMD